MSFTSKRRTHSPTSTSQQRFRKPRRSVWVLLLLLLVWSLCLGVGLAQAAEPLSSRLLAQISSPPSRDLPPSDRPSTQPKATPTTAPVGTVDVVPDRYQTGQKLYLENCATCHIGIPPAVMPTETWRQLIQDPEHYGATIRPLVAPDLQVTWQYIRDFSRPHEAEEQIPYRIYQSKFFKALHPRVKFTAKVTLNTCNSCHIGADKYDFRTLSTEWQNAP